MCKEEFSKALVFDFHYNQIKKSMVIKLKICLDTLKVWPMKLKQKK